MAADTGKSSNLALHLEKIAYGVGGLAALLILLIPYSSTGGLTSMAAQIDEVKQRAIGRIEGDPVPTPVVPDLKKVIEVQWSVPPPPSGSWIPPWTSEARPAVVKLVQKPISREPVHEAGKVVSITPDRDAQKLQVFLVVEAERGTTEQVKFVKTLLLRKEITAQEKGGGDFAQVADLSAAEGKLRYSDYAVLPGKKYAYKLRTEVALASPSAEVKLKSEAVAQESAPLEMADAVPYDYALRIVSATEFSAQTGAKANLNGEVIYWDYAQKKVAKFFKQNWAEGDVFGPKVRGPERYKIFHIQDGKVTVQDRAAAGSAKEELTPALNKRPVELPPPTTLVSAALAPAEGDAPPAPPPAAETETKPAKKKAEPEKTGTAKDKKDQKKDTKKTKKPGIK